MADKTITFTQTVKYDSIPPVVYKQGQKVTLREDLAERWLKRGVATDDAAQNKREDDGGEGTKRTAAPKSAPVEIPAAWRSLRADEKIDLAKKLGAEDKDTATGIAAGDFIEAETKKRDSAAK